MHIWFLWCLFSFFNEKLHIISSCLYFPTGLHLNVAWRSHLCKSRSNGSRTTSRWTAQTTRPSSLTVSQRWPSRRRSPRTRPATHVASTTQPGQLSRQLIYMLKVRGHGINLYFCPSCWSMLFLCLPQHLYDYSVLLPRMLSILMALVLGRALLGIVTYVAYICLLEICSSVPFRVRYYYSWVMGPVLKCRMLFPDALCASLSTCAFNNSSIEIKVYFFSGWNHLLV